MKTLVLFDLDDTLVSSHQLHVESFKKAFLSVYGVEASIDEIYHAGLTVQAIIEKVLELHDVGKEEVLSKINEAIGVMAEFVEKKKPKVLPGVKKLLNKLSKNEEIVLGIVTGLAKKVAMKILEKTGLVKYFKIMSFGDYKEYRREVIEKAVAEAMTPKTVIIGDSIHDVEMAKVFNAKSIAVNTGVTTKEQLKDENPDFFFQDLSDTDKVLKAILK